LRSFRETRGSEIAPTNLGVALSDHGAQRVPHVPIVELGILAVQRGDGGLDVLKQIQVLVSPVVLSRSDEIPPLTNRIC
jgi:hypothetical protein